MKPLVQTPLPPTKKRRGEKRGKAIVRRGHMFKVYFYS
jgi:hypothetical protein